MGFFNNFPYTNFHELNVDWVLSVVKKALAEWETVKGQFANLEEEYAELEKFVKNYFSNLDVSEEIGKKIDEMYASGELAQVVAMFLNNAGVVVFSTLGELKTAENVVVNSTVKTLGYRAVGDNGGATYKIRKVVNTDNVDNGFIVALSNPELVAEIVDPVNIKQFGAYGDGETDDAPYIALACSKGGEMNVPLGVFAIKSEIELKNVKLVGTCPYLRADVYNIDIGDYSTLQFYTPIKAKGVVAEGVLFTGFKEDFNLGTWENEWAPFQPLERVLDCNFTRCTFNNFNYAFYNSGSVVIDHCLICNCNYGVYNVEDSRITNSQIVANMVGITLNDGWGADIISNNKIEWNGSDAGVGFGIDAANTLQLTITGNIIDRCGQYGMSFYNCQSCIVTGNVILRSFEANERYYNPTNFIAENMNYKKSWTTDSGGTDYLPSIGVLGNLGNNSRIVSMSNCDTPLRLDNSGTNALYIVNNNGS